MIQPRCADGKIIGIKYGHLVYSLTLQFPPPLHNIHPTFLCYIYLNFWSVERADGVWRAHNLDRGVNRNGSDWEVGIFYSCSESPYNHSIFFFKAPLPPPSLSIRPWTQDFSSLPTYSSIIIHSKFTNISTNRDIFNIFLAGTSSSPTTSPSHPFPLPPHFLCVKQSMLCIYAKH